MLKRLVRRERTIRDPSDVVSLAERAEFPLEVFRAQLQMKMLLLGLPEPQGVTLYQRLGALKVGGGEDLSAAGQGALRGGAAGACGVDTRVGEEA
jgi:hypothetical protein